MTCHPCRNVRIWAAVVSAVALCFSGVARADEAKPPQESDGAPAPTRVSRTTSYPLEIEPHLTFATGDSHNGFGGGLRLGVPIFQGTVDRAPQNLALSFGADFAHYDNCYYGTACSNDYQANYLLVPAAVQWNVGVARSIGLYLEGGAFLYKGWVERCNSCGLPPDFGVQPTLAIGARVHMGDDLALNMRLGYPTITIGVSFL